MAAAGPVVVERFSRAQLLDDVLAAEGIRSRVTIPLHDGSRIRALLNIASRVPGAFAHEDAPLFGELATVVEGRLLELMRSALDQRDVPTSDAR